jgi:adenylylsulfate reductase subunit B
MENPPGNWVKDIKINFDSCKSCKLCMNACFLDVIRWDDAENKPVATYTEDCVWCLACEVTCPEQCIDIIPNIPAPLHSSF